MSYDPELDRPATTTEERAGIEAAVAAASTENINAKLKRLNAKPSNDHEPIPPNKISKFDEDGLIQLILEEPESCEVLIPHIKFDFFSEAHLQFVYAYIKMLTEKYGNIPSRDLLRDRILKKLTVDDDYKPVLEVINRKPNWRDFPAIREVMVSWLRSRVMKTMCLSDEALASANNGDLSFLEQAAQKLANLESFTNPSNTFGILHYNDLVARSSQQEWLVDGVVLANQPCFLAGPKKAMKTAIALDLAVSVATGRPFLGQFTAPKARKVLFFSGESGDDDVRRRLAAISKSHLLDPTEALDGLGVSFDRPRLGDIDWLKSLTRHLRNKHYEMLIIDPLYLSLMNGGREVNPADLFSMGEALGSIADACRAAGVTPVFCHHFKKSASDRLDLDDMTMTGSAEMARQSILVRRAVPFSTPENNVLQVRFHGAGRGDLYRVLINEGKEMANWGLSVVYEAEAASTEKQVKKTAKEVELIDQLLAAIEVIQSDGHEATKRAIRAETGFNGQTVIKAVNLALEAGEIEQQGDDKLEFYRRK